MMIIKQLHTTSIHTIIDCFLLAFDQYFVEMPSDKVYYIERWKAAQVDFALSYGMFDDEKLVGFILHAIDKRFGVLTAYNAGTGVISEYRGKRIVKALYQFAIEDLKQNGIKKSTLEVITENEKAIKAYEGIGFSTCKTYKCFNGSIHLDNQETFTIVNTNIHKVDWDNLPNQSYYSWDNQKASVLNGGYLFYTVLSNNLPESYFIIKPNSNYIAQCDVLKSGNTAWNRLFSAIYSLSETVKINNVDIRLIDKLQYFESIGLENKIDQYEMELDL